MGYSTLVTSISSIYSYALFTLVPKRHHLQFRQSSVSYSIKFSSLSSSLMSYLPIEAPELLRHLVNNQITNDLNSFESTYRTTTTKNWLWFNKSHGVMPSMSSTISIFVISSFSLQKCIVDKHILSILTIIL